MISRGDVAAVAAHKRKSKKVKGNKKGSSLTKGALMSDHSNKIQVQCPCGEELQVEVEFPDPTSYYNEEIYAPLRHEAGRISVATLAAIVGIVHTSLRDITGLFIQRGRIAAWQRYHKDHVDESESVPDSQPMTGAFGLEDPTEF